MTKESPYQVPIEFTASLAMTRKASEDLTASELRVLRLVASKLQRGLGRAARGHDAESLVQEAIAVTLLGSDNAEKKPEVRQGRRWDKRESFVDHLTSAMGSMAYNLRHRKGNPMGIEFAESEVETVSEEGAGERWLERHASDERLEDAVVQKLALDAAEEALGGRPKVLCMFRCLRVDLDREAIMARCSLTETQYTSTRRDLNRILPTLLKKGGRDV